MEQRLTPQLIQSMAILQKPVADLEAYIQDMLERNAALEIAEPQFDDSAADNGKTPSRQEDGTFDRFARLARQHRELDPDWQDRAPRRKTAPSGEPDAKMGAMANAPGREESLNEYLLEQWTMQEHDENVKRAGETIINQLDPDGMLRARPDEIARSVHPPLRVQDVETALPLVQKLEPAGVGARDLVECLMLQIDALPGDNTIERELVTHHLDDIAHNRLPAIEKETGYSLGEINEAIEAMRRSLVLHPGYLVGDRSVPVIRPDVLIDYAASGSGLDVRLAHGNTPVLRVREDVAELAKNKKNSNEERDFARKHLDEAAALIDAVQFRKARLLEVALAIAEKQREFFNVGPAGLGVLRMSDLAVELECDPSTISRTVADKHVQTPRGIYPMRYFFTGGTETAGGESMGWDRVKLRVREAIEAENPKSPLNDDQVADLLEKEGLSISRRTVAKYRQQMDIPSARKRKKY